MTALPPRACSQCLETFIPEDSRQITCGGACRVAKHRGGRCHGIEKRRIWIRDALGILGVTNRKLRYWLAQYVPKNGERRWGQPRLTFPDLFWLAYIARAREAGVSAQRARHGIPRAQRLLETWPVPLSQTTLVEIGPHLILTAGRYAIEAPEPMVIVDGPELARAVLNRHKRRIRTPIPRVVRSRPCPP